MKTAKQRQYTAHIPRDLSFLLRLLDEARARIHAKIDAVR